MSLIHFNHQFSFINLIHQLHQSHQIHSRFKLVILICMILNCTFRCIQSAPVNSQDLKEENSLKHYLKEPEIIKVNKEKIVLRVFPLLKKDVQVK